MKISKLFHTLYAFLIFLPVMVLPLFAININQKEVEPLTAQIEETQIVDFNQFVDNNSMFFESSGLTISKEQNSYDISVDGTTTASNGFTLFNLEDYIDVSQKIYIRFENYQNSGNDQLTFYTSALYNQSFSLSNTNPSIIITTLAPFRAIIAWGSSAVIDYTFTINIYNLTQMFGIGNEPSIQQFNSWYPNDYYQYTISDKQLLHTGVQDTLDNTDVASQFLYSLYNPLKDYFNLPNYMNLGGLYDWFLVNLFSGYNSPVYFIIFVLMIYWLAMSILWLIFDVLMYVPSMIHKMLDKARME